MNRIEAFKDVNNLSEDEKTLYMKIMCSTLDLVNEMIDKEKKAGNEVTPFVFFEHVAYKVMFADMWAHLKNDEFYDVLFTKTWKKISDE